MSQLLAAIERVEMKRDDIGQEIIDTKAKLLECDKRLIATIDQDDMKREISDTRAKLAECDKRLIEAQEMRIRLLKAELADCHEKYESVLKKLETIRQLASPPQ
jgi:hypothetical protein